MKYPYLSFNSKISQINSNESTVGRLQVFLDLGLSKCKVSISPLGGGKTKYRVLYQMGRRPMPRYGMSEKGDFEGLMDKILMEHILSKNSLDSELLVKFSWSSNGKEVTL